MKKLFYNRLSALLTGTLLFISVHTTLAQQEAMYSQYMFNMLAVNPGYAGSRDVLSITGLYRQMWAGIKGAPVTQTLSLDAPLNRERVGLGLQIFNDNAGVIGNRGVYGSYAFRVKVSQKATLSLGLQAGVTNFYADLSGQNTGNPDPAFNQNPSKFLPNFGTGIYFSTDRFYAGISCPHIMRNRLSDFSAGTSADQEARQQRHFFGMLGFVIRASNSLKIKPSVLAKAVAGAPVAVDANLNFWIRDRLSLGGSFRTSNLTMSTDGTFKKSIGDAVVGMIELQLSDQLRFGYAYDYMLNDLQGYNSGSHEVMLRYEFGYGKKRILTPRYF